MAADGTGIVMTKRAARAQRIAWDTARSEQRVVSYRTLGRMVSYPTIAARDAAIAAAETAGIPAIIVPRPGEE